MKAVVQRVAGAAVSVGKDEISRIGPGLFVLLGVGRDDDETTAARLAAKLLKLRIFEDADGRMNESVGEREILCVSQFTLYGDTSRGNRPGWGAAAAGPQAEPLYDLVCERLKAARGAFGAEMQISLVADGPVTLSLEV